MDSDKEQNIDHSIDLEVMRHSSAHVLAQAVIKFFPDAKLGIGPAIDDGFYYDFEFSEPFNEEDLQKIEDEMKAIIKADLPFKQVRHEREGAIQRYEGLDQIYKLDLLSEIEDQELSFFITGDDDFIDLCRGPHLESTGQIGAVKLLRTSGAYWRGDEKNQMLTRIYGTAFHTEKEIEDYLAKVEKAKENDHRKLGKELDLFTYSDAVGKGLPLWTPKGSIIRRELENFVVESETERGYQHVYTPELAKTELYRKSGHYPYYTDSMYSPIKVDDEEFLLRPMTCPHHFELYLSQPRSYKELPMRIAELAKLYRYEKSGELSGLIRVRSFCLSDAHIICADAKQAAEEVRGALELHRYFFDTFGLKAGENYTFRLSLGNRDNTEKYFDDAAAWDESEKLLRQVLKEHGEAFEEAEDEAAFYGPKIDIQMKNILGKEDTALTVQYDFVMPKRFDLKYVNSDGEDQEAVVVHRSGIGAFERTIAFLIEHFGGAFPTWLSPEQVRILPISDKHLEYAKELEAKLKKKKIRVWVDDRNEKLGYKIRDAEVNKLPYTLVVGDKELETQTVAVRVRGLNDQGLHKAEDFINSISLEIENKDVSPSLD